MKTRPTSWPVAQRPVAQWSDLSSLRVRPAPPSVDLILLGVGSIGRELLAQLACSGRPPVAADARIRICGLIDRSGYIFDPHGLGGQAIERACRHKGSGGSLAQLSGHAATAREAIARIARMSAGGSCRTILVDATAADTHAELLLALTSGWDVVLANKVPLAADQSRANELWRVSRTHGCRILHEATVGAGLPVIDTLRKLLEAGDRVTCIEGCPSGTLGYLFGEMGRGQSFSTALRSAIAAGYTEPDSRVDLCGLDVARKALILARHIGFSGNLGDIEVESLVPHTWRDCSHDDFLNRVSTADAEWAERCRAARADGRVLRYRARITPTEITVGLVAVEVAAPLGGLSGTDNQFAFATSRYDTQPLIIRGPGAGAAVTAAGVYNDVLRLASMRTN